MPTVIAENDVSNWNDKTGAVYHFPKRYSALLKPGTRVIYYKGKLQDKTFSQFRLSEQPHYFGAARIGSINPDPNSIKGDLLATIEDYQPFEFAVLARDRDGYLESIPPSMAKNYWRNGVRQIHQTVFDSILARATVKAESTEREMPFAHFEVVTEVSDIAALNAKLSDSLKKAFPHKERRELTYPAGHHTGTVFFENASGQKVRGWSPITRDPERHANHLLFGEPGTTSWLELAVQLNFPKKSYKRTYAGAFVRDESGRFFVAHRGKLTRGKAGLAKEQVLSHFSTCVTAIDKNKTTRVILIADIEDPNLVDKLFKFAYEAREAANKIADGVLDEKLPKKDTKHLNTKEKTAILSAYFDEYSGESIIKTSKSSGTRVVRHGAIVSALAESLSEAGFLKKSQAIDLAVVHEDSASLYEVKTSADTQSVYTAVGQLLIHGELLSNLIKCPIHTFLVLPEPPRKDLLTALEKAMGASVLIYKELDNSYIFSDL